MQTYRMPENSRYNHVKDKAEEGDYNQSFVFMDESEYEFFEERAAIVEYESHLTREDAERLAYKRLLELRAVYAQAS